MQGWGKITSHDAYADFAASALATHFQSTPADCFNAIPTSAALSIFAGREGKSQWPFADGVFDISVGGTQRNVALEFKRQSEGVHGMLTALGQAHSYLHKGYDGSVIVVSNSYGTHNHPGRYLAEVLGLTSSQQPIGVFSYSDPDFSLLNPFMGKLMCHRPIQVNLSGTAAVAASKTKTTAIGIETQWAHTREGSSTPSAFYRYLLTARQLPADIATFPAVTMPADLVTAIQNLRPGADPHAYLAYVSKTAFHDLVWAHFWYGYVLTSQVMEIWVTPLVGPYSVNSAPTRLLRADGKGAAIFFAGRSDSIENKIVDKLNSGMSGEPDAWKEFAGNVRGRAHSLREDIDSGLEALGMLASDGKPTELGHRFIDACERSGSPNAALPRAMIGAALLKNGHFNALLHYIYKLSEARFRTDPLAFAVPVGKGYTFERQSYLAWIEDQLANQLRVLSKSSVRGGTARKPLQAELTMLSKVGFVSEDANNRFRIGVGLVIDWPTVQEATDLAV